jgi:hypothetical protein
MAKVVTDGDIGSGLEIVANKLIRSAITKEDVGLGNVDNTSDVNKPISSATQTAISGTENYLTKYGVSGIVHTGIIEDANKIRTSVGVVSSSSNPFKILQSVRFTGNGGLSTEDTGGDLSFGTSSATEEFIGARIFIRTPQDWAQSTSRPSDIVFSNANIGSTVLNDRMILRHNGNLLINTSTDNGLDKLQVNGSVSIETFAYLKPSTAPSILREGTVYYDSSSKKLRCWDGTTWNDLF